jgi:hypothetical protein
VTVEFGSALPRSESGVQPDLSSDGAPAWAYESFGALSPAWGLPASICDFLRVSVKMCTRYAPGQGAGQWNRRLLCCHFDPSSAKGRTRVGSPWTGLPGHRRRRVPRTSRQRTSVGLSRSRATGRRSAATIPGLAQCADSQDPDHTRANSRSVVKPTLICPGRATIQGVPPADEEPADAQHAKRASRITKPRHHRSRVLSVPANPATPKRHPRSDQPSAPQETLNAPALRWQPTAPGATGVRPPAAAND